MAFWSNLPWGKITSNRGTEVTITIHMYSSLCDTEVTKSQWCCNWYSALLLQYIHYYGLLQIHYQRDNIIMYGRAWTTKKKIELLPNSSMRELRKKIKDRVEVEPDRQVLVYKYEELVDEHPKTNKEMLLEDTVEFKGSVKNAIINFENIWECSNVLYFLVWTLSLSRHPPWMSAP